MKKVSPFLGILFGIIVGYYWEDAVLYFEGMEWAGLILYFIVYAVFSRWFKKAQPTW